MDAKICGHAAPRFKAMFEDGSHSSDKRGCTDRPASDGRADAMLPAHGGPLPLLPAQPLQAGAQAYERISAPISFRPQMHQPVCPPTGIWTTPQPLQYVLVAVQLDDAQGAAPDRTIERAGLTCMTASGHPSNQLLQMLGVADFDLLRPHLATVEMVRESVLAEAGAALRHVYFPHGGSVSITVGLSEGQMIEVAMLGRDSAVGAGAALADGIAPTDAAVLFPGTASVLEIAAFRAVAAASAQFRGLMIRHEQALLAHAQQSVLCNTVHPVEARGLLGRSPR